MNAAKIRELVVNALIVAKTDAGDRVYSPRDWSTRSEDYPSLLVQTPFDEKQSLGRNAPQFNSVATIRITGRVEAFDGEANDGAMQAEAALETLREQVERAVVNSYDLTLAVQQFRHIRSAIQVDAAGDGHIGQLTYEIDVEYYQGPEDFYPVDGVPLQGVDVTIQQPDGTTRPGFNADLPQ